ncbi:hypothetical protein PRIPAC_91152 [Pristionchus pacificus]|uniref:Uncharacterized protein n=1 Tax=Pristionchus pacificus TaxID=54126 RepID=A0A2A6CXL7_PRIPA|nr:hypothetical protein PRIPAC_91152 [Pristionchus pacificus]|eukprot:PDM82974.1 hypothetical protein PRIPAC_37367 [Pristionchus pacificus]
MAFEILRTLSNVKVDKLDFIGIPIHQSKNIRALIERHNVFHVGLDLRDDFLTRQEICSILIDIADSNVSMHLSARSDAVTDRDWIAFAQQLISEKGASAVSMFIKYKMDLESTVIGVLSPCAQFMRMFDGYV